MVAAARHRENWALRVGALLGAAVLLLTVGCAKSTATNPGVPGASGATGASADIEAMLASALADQVGGRADAATVTYQKVLKLDASNKVAL